MAMEINVDAITCPTRFNSVKGQLDASPQELLPAAQRPHHVLQRRLRHGGRERARLHGQRDELRGAQRSRRGRGRHPAVRRAVRGRWSDPATGWGRGLRDARRGEQGVRQQRRSPPPVVRRIRISRVMACPTTSASRRWCIACRFASTPPPAARRRRPRRRSSATATGPGRTARSSRVTGPYRPPTPARARGGCWKFPASPAPAGSTSRVKPVRRDLLLRRRRPRPPRSSGLAVNAGGRHLGRRHLPQWRGGSPATRCATARATQSGTANSSTRSARLR